MRSFARGAIKQGYLYSDYNRKRKCRLIGHMVRRGVED